MGTVTKIKKETEKRTTIIVRIPTALLKRLDALLAKLGKESPLLISSRNNAIIAAVETVVEKFEK